jgi:hypothetical protein
MDEVSNVFDTKIHELSLNDLIKVALFLIIVGAIANFIAIWAGQKWL